MGDYYQGNSVFTSLSSVFGSNTAGNTAAPVPVTSDFFGKVEGFMKKEIYGIPIWILIIIVVAILIVAFVVV